MKTRLCPPLSADDAARLATGLLDDVVARLGSRVSGLRIVAAPASARPWFTRRYPGIEVHVQRGDGLAERLANGFDEALLEPGVESVVALGSDQPWVGAEVLAEAHALLRGVGGRPRPDVVLGPDEGGGYYLIGLRRACRELFTTVTMSTSGMCAATMAAAEARGLTVALLREDYDVDVEADLLRLCDDLMRVPSADKDYPRHTAACLRALDLLPPA